MGRAAAPQRTCDAPGCTVLVKRGILMCRAHWFRTPAPLRQAITETWRSGQTRAWSANCLEARRWHVANPPAAAIARLTGETL